MKKVLVPIISKEKELFKPGPKGYRTPSVPSDILSPHHYQKTVKDHILLILRPHSTSHRDGCIGVRIRSTNIIYG